jgi:archaeoflavoprotein AfpA
LRKKGESMVQAEFSRARASLQKKFVWGITGSGDEIDKIFRIMRSLSQEFSEIEIRVYISKAGEQVLRWYRVLDEVKQSFERVKIETSYNIPFLAGELQSGKYDFLIVAPTTSNTTAKIALGIGDTMITNAVNMATKARVPVYVLPCEMGEGETVTVLPNGKELRLIIRDVDSGHINTLEKSTGITVLKSPDDIRSTVKSYYI